MSYSLNETEVLIRKAAIGAGWPLGIAVDLGRAAVFACCDGEDGPRYATEILTAEDGLSRMSRMITALDAARDKDYVPYSGEPLFFPLAQALAQERGGAFVVEAGQLRFAAKGKTATTRNVRANISAADLDALKALAHKTFVPASAESRLGGAGAGLTDND